MELIDCRSIADNILTDLEGKFAALEERTGIWPVLAAIANADNPESMSYLKSRRKPASRFGIDLKEVTYRSDSTPSEIMGIIRESSESKEIHGIMVSYPVPSSLGNVNIGDMIPPGKDVDCITPMNQGLIMENREFVAPATALSVIEIILREGIAEGSRVAILNRSTIIGRPLAMMLLNRNFTPVVCHTRTIGIREITKSADVVVAAAGKARLIDSSWISDGATVIDAGINVENGKICGDVDPVSMNERRGRLTPVPGGVGPITSGMLFRNLLKCVESAVRS